MKWDNLAKNLLKSELKKRGVNYEQLQEKLAVIGVDETVNNINRKINRGAFQFTFFLQCAVAMGIKNLRLDELVAGEEHE
jgi:hypothetical protein